MPSLENLAVEPYLALVVALAVVCQSLAWRIRLPSILLLLVVGFGLGQLVTPEDVLGRDILFGGVAIAVGIILFEGALSLSFAEVRDLGQPIVRLCTVTVVLAWVLITLAGVAVGLSPEIALLGGAILVVTGPTVIAPILRQLRPTKRISLLLRWEGIVVDPIGAVLAVLVYQGLVAGRTEGALLALMLGLGTTVLISVVVAAPLGVVLAWLTKQHLIPDFLHGAAFLGVAVAALVVSNELQAESGLLTVTILGIGLANVKGLHLEHVREFFENLQVLFVGALFVVLAGRVTPEQLLDVLPQGLLLVALLVVVVRPLSIYLGLWGTTTSTAERRLLSGMAPRGIIAAAVTSIFALEFEHAADELDEQAAEATGAAATELARQAENLAGLAEEAAELVPVVFLVIVVTVALYGLGVGRLAERLGLASGQPQGVLLAGSSPWVVDLAEAVEGVGVPAVVVDREYTALARARRAGITTEVADILSDYAVKDMELAGLGHLVACTPDDQVNAAAAREFGQVLGRQNVYQLRRHDADPDNPRRGVAAHLDARTCFQPAVSHQDLTDRVERGAVVKTTSLTEEFTRADFADRYGDDAVLMFVQRGEGTLSVVTPETELPDHGLRLIALVPSGQP